MMMSTIFDPPPPKREKPNKIDKNGNDRAERTPFNEANPPLADEDRSAPAEPVDYDEPIEGLDARDAGDDIELPRPRRGS